MKYLLVVTALVGMDTVWGMSFQNSTLAGVELENPQILARSKRDFGLTAAIVGAAAASASAATGLAASKLTNNNHGDYNRNVEGRIENLLKWPLVNPRSSEWWGTVSSQPTIIRSCEISSVAAHKTGHTATGTSGIFSWKIREKDVTVIVLWSVPYDPSDCNSLGLGIYKGLSDREPSYKNRYTYFNHLYYYNINYPYLATNAWKTINFRYYCRSTREICTSNYGIWVCATMSTNAAGMFDVRIGTIENATYCVGKGTGRVPERRP